MGGCARLTRDSLHFAAHPRLGAFAGGYGNLMLYASITMEGDSVMLVLSVFLRAVP